ncbi:MAG: glycerophosphodiester phosphodiesterase family protein [Paracoccaceae bacterium]
MTKFAPYIVRGALLSLAFAAGTAQAATLNTLTGEAPIVIAHRGASGYQPEHTLAAYELAADMGVDYIEPDVQITADGYLVAMHDATLNRTTNVESLFAPRNGGYSVSDFTLAEIRTLTVDITPVSSAHAGFVPTYTSTSSVMTLDEVVDFVNQYNADHGTNIGIYPEAKAASSVLNQKIVETLAAGGFTSTAADNVYIQSFSVNALTEIAGLQSTYGTDIDLIALGYASGDQYTGTDGGPLDLSSLVGVVDGFGIYIGTGKYALTSAFVDLAHSLGFSVVGWTFAKADEAAALAEYQYYIDMGLDGFFANYPDYAVTAVAENTAPVPVPAALGLSLAGLGGLGALSLRRRKAA